MSGIQAVSSFLANFQNIRFIENSRNWTYYFQFNRELVFRINVDGTMLLMDYCRRLGVTRFVYTSSVGVIFTNKELINATEDYPYPDDSEVTNKSCDLPEVTPTKLYFTVLLRLQRFESPS